MIAGLREAVIESALTDLITAIHDFHEKGGSYFDVDVALEGAVEALGSDPREIVQDYLVSLEISFEARSPEDAVKQFIALCESDGMKSWVYKTTDENDNEVVIDTYNFEW